MSLSNEATATQVRTGVRTREAALEDYEQIAALQARHGLTTRSYADWCSLWTENPAALRTGAKHPIGWVLESERGTVAGFLGNLALSYTFQGRPVKAATAHSWVVDSKYRGHSIRLLSTFLDQRSTDLFIFATVNTAAETVVRLCGLTRVPSGQWGTARFWVTGYKGFARSATQARGIPFSGWVAPPLAGILWLQDWLFRRAPSMESPAIPRLNIGICSSFDERFGPFWREYESQNRARLLAVRDPETLAWHYGPALRRGTAWIVTATLSGRIVAFWVVDRQDHPDLQLKRLRFVDFVALPGYEHLLRTAVQWTLALCKRDGIHVAENPGAWIERYRVRGTSGPYRRQLKSWLFYYRARHPELANQLKNPDVWTPSSYDGDASL